MDQSFSPTLTKHLGQTPPSLLHHYTTQSGLIGIIENSVLWATKAHYMNDSTEFSIALKIAEEKIYEKSRVKIPDGFIFDIQAMPADEQIAVKMYNAIRKIQNVNIVVACFCEHADLLSQWRGYTHNSYGYSVGFNSKDLQSESKAPFTLGKCIYSADAQKTIVTDLVNIIKEKASDSDDIPSVMKDFSDTLIRYGVYFKNASFEEEKEWRLASPPLNVSELFFQTGKVHDHSIWPYPLRTRGAITNKTGSCWSLPPS